jgi:hypothetical protein
MHFIYFAISDFFFYNNLEYYERFGIELREFFVENGAF